MTSGISREKKHIDWSLVDTVLLDMDGTLLDKHFDDYFWEHYVPEQYAAKNRITTKEAKSELLAKYKRQEGKLEWTDLDYWSEMLGLDIHALKMKIDHLVAVHPYVIDFLEFCRSIGKRIYLVTNAHEKTLEIKMRKTALGKYFDGIVVSAELGMAKEERLFWSMLQKRIRFDPERTMLADDTERILHAAQHSGIRYLIFVAKSSSNSPMVPSLVYPSIYYFNELIDQRTVDN